MHEIDLILTLTGGLAAALVCGYVTFRLGLSPIVGYLLAGFLVGPNTPGFVADQELADQLAEIGIILLMFGVGLAVPPGGAAGRAQGRGARGAWRESLAATLLGTAGRPGRRVGLVGGRRLRPGDLGGQHGRAAARAGRRRRSAHPGGPHRGRLAGRRGPARGLRAGAAAGRLRQGRRGGGRTRASARSRVVLAVVKVGAMVGAHALRRRPADPLAARSRRGDPLARAVHADRARLGAGDRRGLGAGCSASRWRWARSSPAWSWGDRSSACGRRPRPCRCATPSPCCSSSRSGCCSTRTSPARVAGPGGRHAGRDPAGQAAGGAGRRADARPAAAHGGRGRRRAGPDRRVLVHPRRRRAVDGDPRRRGRQHDRRRGHHLDHDQPAAITGWNGRSRAVLRRFIGEPPVSGLAAAPGSSTDRDRRRRNPIATGS